MLKKFSILTCIICTLVMCGSCSKGQVDNPNVNSGHNHVQVEVISLTEEESDLLKVIGEDVQVISEHDYPNTVTELQYHPDVYSGQVLQLEGILKTVSINGVEVPFVYRILNNDGVKNECGLPLKYLQKEISDGSWVRVTAIVNVADFNGITQTVMEVVAIEAPAEVGSSELNWNGSHHNH